MLIWKIGPKSKNSVMLWHHAVFYWKLFLVSLAVGHVIMLVVGFAFCNKFYKYHYSIDKESS